MNDSHNIEDTAVQWRNLGLLAAAEMLTMTPWFSASAVVSALREEWNLSASAGAWLTMSVQIGFVVGTLATRMFRDRALRLANLSYLGHMWELYAMWTWVPVFMVEVACDRGHPAALGSVVAFAVIAVGGIGCVAAGALADRWGRTTITVAAMTASAAALLAALFVAAPLAVLVAILAVWGFTVVADSAQFSAAITELSEPEYLGRALTLQTAIGFLLTLFTIQVVPEIVDAGGWSWAFALLALGPVFGVAAMLRLRASPEARKLAGGRG